MGTFIGKLAKLAIIANLLVGCTMNQNDTVTCALNGHNCPNKPGLNGRDGRDGAPGSGCSVATVDVGPVAPHGGARITCSDGSDVLLLNGAPGAVGPQGPVGPAAPATPFTIVQAITPCPNLPGAHAEVILVMQNRQLLASVSNSDTLSNTRLAFISVGSWRTTDGRNCNFTVTASQITWAGGAASY